MLFKHQLLQRRFSAMHTLLHLDSSPMGDASVSRHMSSTFAEQWKRANPDGKIITRDITTTPLTPVDAAWVGAVYTPVEARTAEQNATLALSDTLVGELFGADEWVFGVPMYNFGIPAAMKEWIDQIARVNVTFSYAGGTPKGLLTGKKLTVLIATGGVYDAGTAMAGLNFVEPYLKNLFGFLGVTDVAFHTAGGAGALNYGADRAAFLKPHEEAIALLAAA
jgi:FMN-dependent NADH-azoreductase